MKLEIEKLNLGKYFIDEVVSFSEEYLANSPIKKLDNIKVKGSFYFNYNNEIEYDLAISGTMILTDCYNLEPFPYEFSLNCHEIVDETQEIYEKKENTLDIMEILWQNIVLEVPIRVGNSDTLVNNGEGWELVKEDKKNIDPRLSKLTELLVEDKKEV